MGVCDLNDSSKKTHVDGRKICKGVMGCQCDSISLPVPFTPSPELFFFTINAQLMVNWWFGILGIPLSNNPFHKGILGIQTTNQPLVEMPNQKKTTATCPMSQKNSGQFVLPSAARRQRRWWPRWGLIDPRANDWWDVSRCDRIKTNLQQ